ncbi:hypothetical protein BZA77DRAFT_344567 [Pyronema omphalodes]|nr:hypothetical protein BZA77DRAFT_344567 [Pyronema omphalodes]
MNLLTVFTFFSSLLLLFTPTFAQGSRTFRLRADTKAPASISSLGFVTSGYGFSKTPSTPWRGYIEPYGNRTEPGQEGWGTLHDVMMPGSIVYLRPTHGTPMYFVLVGDPQRDPTPPLTRWDSWGVIKSPQDGREFLGMGEWTNGWMGCYGKDTGEYSLYFGPQIGGDGGPCTVTFALEVVWD